MHLNRVVPFALLGAAVCTLWPAWQHAGAVIPGDPTSDAYDHLWGYWWWAYALGHLENPLRTTLSHQPPGGTLWFVDPLNALLAAPLQTFVSTATATTTVLTAQVFGTLLAVWLGLRKQSPLGAPVAAVVVGAGAYTLGLLQSGVYEFVAIGPVAAFYFALRNGVRPGATAAFWVLAAVANFYYAAFAGLLALVWLVESPGSWRQFARAAALALPPITLLAMFALTTLHAPDAVVHAETAPGWVQGNLPAVDPLAFVHPGGWFFPDNARSGNVGIVHVPYIGWVAILLAGLGLVAHRADAIRCGALGWRVPAALALAFVFALGPSLALGQHPLRVAAHDVWMPLAVLYFPGSPVQFIHHPYRLVVVLLLAMAPLVAGGVEAAARRLPARAGWLAPLVLSLIFLAEAHWISPIGSLPAHASRTAPVDPDPFTLQAATDPTVTGIFNFPPDAHHGNRRYEMLAIFHQKRMPYGVNSFLPDAWAHNGLVIALLGCLTHPQVLGVPREGGPPPRTWFARNGLASPRPTPAQIDEGTTALEHDGYSHIVLADTLTRGDRDEVITLLAWHAERVQESVYRLGGSPSGQTAVPRR